MIIRQYEDVIRKLKRETRRTSELDTYKVGRVYSVVPKRAWPTVYYHWSDSGTLEIWHEIYGRTYANPLPFEIEECRLTPLRIRILSKHWEPLWAITEQGAMDEGIYKVEVTYSGGEATMYRHRLSNKVYFTAVEAYRDLWDGINGETEFRWVNNPQVCVHTFSLVEE